MEAGFRLDAGFGEWLTIFGGWRGTVPSIIEEGSKVSSCVKFKGFRNSVHWTVTRYDEPKSIELRGRGRGGIQLKVAMDVADKDPGSTFHLIADLKGGVLSGPVGRVVAGVLRSDVPSRSTTLPHCTATARRPGYRAG